MIYSIWEGQTITLVPGEGPPRFEDGRLMDETAEKTSRVVGRGVPEDARPAWIQALRDKHGREKPRRLMAIFRCPWCQAKSEHPSEGILVICPQCGVKFETIDWRNYMVRKTYERDPEAKIDGHQTR